MPLTGAGQRNPKNNAGIIKFINLFRTTKPLNCVLASNSCFTGRD